MAKSSLQPQQKYALNSSMFLHTLQNYEPNLGEEIPIWQKRKLNHGKGFATLAKLSPEFRA
ncbi:MAG: hypothetical protein J5658_08320 [Prevotella sp.]|nr:hypothetical protein [Prevotella sp.]